MRGYDCCLQIHERVIATSFREESMRVMPEDCSGLESSSLHQISLSDDLHQASLPSTPRSPKIFAAMESKKRKCQSLLQFPVAKAPNYANKGYGHRTGCELRLTTSETAMVIRRVLRWHRRSYSQRPSLQGPRTTKSQLRGRASELTKKTGQLGTINISSSAQTKCMPRMRLSPQFLTRTEYKKKMID